MTRRSRFRAHAAALIVCLAGRGVDSSPTHNAETEIPPVALDVRKGLAIAAESMQRPDDFNVEAKLENPTVAPGSRLPVDLNPYIDALPPPHAADSAGCQDSSRS